MNKLLIATHNPGKIWYFKRMFDGFDLQLLSLDDFPYIKDAPTENGRNETENALIKARYYSSISGEVSMSDDAGMYIPALNNEPGLAVRRWMGRFSDEVSDEEWLAYFVKRMKDVPKEERNGVFKSSRAIVTPEGKEYFLYLTREVIIREEPNWKYYKEGLPMSTMCIEKKFFKAWADLSDEENREYEKNNLKKFKKIFIKIYK